MIGQQPETFGELLAQKRPGLTLPAAAANRLYQTASQRAGGGVRPNHGQPFARAAQPGMGQQGAGVPARKTRAGGPGVASTLGGLGGLFGPGLPIGGIGAAIGAAAQAQQGGPRPAPFGGGNPFEAGGGNPLDAQIIDQLGRANIAGMEQAGQNWRAGLNAQLGLANIGADNWRAGLGTAGANWRAGLGEAGQNWRAGLGEYGDTYRAHLSAALQDHLSERETGARLQMNERNAVAQELPHRLYQGRFDQTMPYLQQQAGQAWNIANSAQRAQSPNITVGPVWSDQQIQQQVNSRNAAIGQETAARQRASREGMASRGFAGNSPLIQDLLTRMDMQGLAQKTENERDVRMQMANRNARHLLDTERAREQQFASREQEFLQNRGQGLNLVAALMGNIAGIVG